MMTCSLLWRVRSPSTQFDLHRYLPQLFQGIVKYVEVHVVKVAFVNSAGHLSLLLLHQLLLHHSQLTLHIGLKVFLLILVERLLRQTQRLKG